MENIKEVVSNNGNMSDANAAEVKNYNFIDVVKFICAMLVIAIHVPPLSGMHWILNFTVVHFIARVAVPFFFVSSAYFVFKKAYNNPKYELDYTVIFKYIKKILRLYIIWSVIYAPFAYYHILEVSSTVTIPQFLKYYAIRAVLSTSYGHLWYLNAIIAAYLIFILMTAMKIKPAAIAAFSLIMYCLGLCAQSWFGLIEPLRRFPQIWSFLLELKRIFETTRNGLCEGLVFIVIGRFFATHNVNWKMKNALIMLVGSLILFAAEFFMLLKLDWIREYDMYFGIIPTVFFMFYVSMNVKLPNRTIYKKMRTTSALIYFSHMLFAEILILCPKFSGFLGGGAVKYAFAFFASLIFSAVVIRLSYRFKILKYLYK